MYFRKIIRRACPTLTRDIPKLQSLIPAVVALATVVVYLWSLDLLFFAWIPGTMIVIATGMGTFRQYGTGLLAFFCAMVMATVFPSLGAYLVAPVLEQSLFIAFVFAIQMMFLSIIISCARDWVP